MKKVLVIGSGGSGKSTFSVRLGRLLNIEVIHLDVLYWKPGWVETPKPEWRETVIELLERERWIIDGNYSGTFDIRFAACDTVIFLDVARSVCLWRVLKRLLLYRFRGRPDMAAGCRERFDPKFMAWVWGYPARTRPRVLQLLKDNSESKHIVHLRTQSEIDGFLGGIQNHVVLILSTLTQTEGDSDQVLQWETGENERKPKPMYASRHLIRASFSPCSFRFHSIEAASCDTD